MIKLYKIIAFILILVGTPYQLLTYMPEAYARVHDDRTPTTTQTNAVPVAASSTPAQLVNAQAGVEGVMAQKNLSNNLAASQTVPTPVPAAPVQPAATAAPVPVPSATTSFGTSPTTTNPVANPTTGNPATITTTQAPPVSISTAPAKPGDVIPVTTSSATANSATVGPVRPNSPANFSISASTTTTTANTQTTNTGNQVASNNPSTNTSNQSNATNSGNRAAANANAPTTNNPTNNNNPTQPSNQPDIPSTIFNYYTQLENFRSLPTDLVADIPDRVQDVTSFTSPPTTLPTMPQPPSAFTPAASSAPPFPGQDQLVYKKDQWGRMIQTSISDNNGMIEGIAFRNVIVVNIRYLVNGYETTGGQETTVQQWLVPRDPGTTNSLKITKDDRAPYTDWSHGDTFYSKRTRKTPRGAGAALGGVLQVDKVIMESDSSTGSIHTVNIGYNTAIPANPMSSYSESMNWLTPSTFLGFGTTTVEKWDRDLAGYDNQYSPSEGKSGFIYSIGLAYATRDDQGLKNTYTLVDLYANGNKKQTVGKVKNYGPLTTPNGNGIYTIKTSYEVSLSVTETNVPPDHSELIVITPPQNPASYVQSTEIVNNTNTGVTTTHTEKWNEDSARVKTGMESTIITDSQNPTNSDELYKYYVGGTPTAPAYIITLHDTRTGIPSASSTVYHEYSRTNQDKSTNNTESLNRTTTLGRSAGNLINQALNLVEKKTDGSGNAVIDLSRSSSASVNPTTNTATGFVSIEDKVVSNGSGPINYTRKFTVTDTRPDPRFPLQFTRSIVLDFTKDGFKDTTLKYSQTKSGPTTSTPTGVWLESTFSGPIHDNFYLDRSNWGTTVGWRTSVGRQKAHDAAQYWLTLYNLGITTEQSYFSSAAFIDSYYSNGLNVF